MNIEEIRANAPKGATHYRIIKAGREVEYYMRPPYGMNLKYCHGVWRITGWSHNSFIKPLNLGLYYGY
ncbi:hypothetical protein AB2_30 [Acinetobacter phage vB_AbaM-IME-AB2]|uniref:Uncharacterized protein n=1 Tax=Acinetobacter phage vB_AbaM-IME-AB2 TaxID=1243183 RepID=K4NXI3_9CAUD|nr:hypothetical protein FDG67_gp30 [Acinetobacter phage vB_AbaM-IME-AB2]AFV51514.1 hypothetical protein AB2_30 [Acinetobacter phage vB_AbaM-IME-AB2]